MTAAPKAISHGLGAGAGATFGAFFGISAPNAGAATETASAAAIDNTTFFIESAPLIRSAPGRAGPLSHLSPRVSREPQSRRRITHLACVTGDLDPPRYRSARRKQQQVLPFWAFLAAVDKNNVSCCANVTKHDAWWALAGRCPHPPFDTALRVGSRLLLLFSGWPQAVNRRGPRCRRSPDG